MECPACPLAVPPKLYVYGHLNRVRSGRRLERETPRNVELIWLTEPLTPDRTTTVDNRGDNRKAIRRACRELPTAA
jgi:transposase